MADLTRERLVEIAGDAKDAAWANHDYSTATYVDGITRRLGEPKYVCGCGKRFDDLSMHGSHVEVVLEDAVVDALLTALADDAEMMAAICSSAASLGDPVRYADRLRNLLPKVTVDDLAGIDPQWTGDLSTQEYLDRQRGE